MVDIYQDTEVDALTPTRYVGADQDRSLVIIHYMHITDISNVSNLKHVIIRNLPCVPNSAMNISSVVA